MFSEVFEYTLAHDSEQLSRMEQEKESKIYKEARHYKALFRHDMCVVNVRCSVVLRVTDYKLF